MYFVILILFIFHTFSKYVNWNGIHVSEKHYSKFYPSIRNEFCLIKNSENLEVAYLFHGNYMTNGDFEGLNNEVHKFDLNTLRWKKIGEGTYYTKKEKARAAERVIKFQEYDPKNIPQAKATNLCVKGSIIEGESEARTILIYGGNQGKMYDEYDNKMSFNELYEFNPKNEQFRKLRKNLPFSYGTPRLFSDEVNPFYLYQPSIIKYKESFFLFSGIAYNYTEKIEEYFNVGDIFQYSYVKNQYAWVTNHKRNPKFSKEKFIGNYTDFQQFSSSSYPYGRSGATLFLFNDLLYIFGGINSDAGFDCTEVLWFNDVWAYNISSDLWKWDHGNYSKGLKPIDFHIEKRGEYNINNIPRSRNNHLGLKFSETEFFIFGGRQSSHYTCFDCKWEVCGQYACFNSLWIYDITRSQWKIQNGTDELIDNRWGQYSVQNMNIGSRWSNGVVKNEKNDFYLFFGGGGTKYNYTKKNNGWALNDFWVFFPNRKEFTCYDFIKYSYETCSRHGECTKNDHCECLKGYKDNECETPICPTNCSGHGKCLSPNFCSCEKEYKSNDCSVPKCYDYFADDKRVCSSHGDCVEVNDCQCNDGWKEKECSEFYCKFSCNNGKCTAANHCECNAGFSGKFCSKNVTIDNLVLILSFLIPITIILLCSVAILGYLFYRANSKRGNKTEKTPLLRNLAKHTTIINVSRDNKDTGIQ